jgi:hypothetical protein
MTCRRAAKSSSNLPPEVFKKNLEGIWPFWKFSFLPKTARLKGKEKKRKEMTLAGSPDFGGRCLWIGRIC